MTVRSPQQSLADPFSRRRDALATRVRLTRKDGLPTGAASGATDGGGIDEGRDRKRRERMGWCGGH